MSGLTQKRFWRLVDATAIDLDINAQAASLRKLLGTLKKQELSGFIHNERMFFDRAFQCNLWDFAVVIFGGCNEEKFHNFRIWLVFRGKQLFKDSLKNPEILVPELRKYTGVGRGEIGAVSTQVADTRFGIGQWEVPETDSPMRPEGKRLPEAKLETAFPKAWREFQEPQRWLE